ncbi:Troponin I 4, partial [Fragariocoptes setiger]
EEKRKREERERKKAEVRARLEAASASKTKKKGFMTPERKKKLRLLLRRKAAEELKRQQETKAAERKQVISQRTGDKVAIDSLSDDQLKSLILKYHDRIANLESEKWDLEYQVGRKDLDIHELAFKVNDMRGKFIKPPLKKIPKYEAKIERMLLNARKEIGFTVELKSVKKDQFKADETKTNKAPAPEWAWKKGGQAGAAAAMIEGVRVYILARHGKNHDCSPSHVNYRANLWTLVQQLNCTHILVTSACGSLQEHIEPGHVGILDQYIDRTTSLRDRLRNFFKCVT